MSVDKNKIAIIVEQLDGLTMHIVKANNDKRRKDEVLLCECSVCGKKFHIREALYCPRCASKLDLENAVLINELN